MYTPFVKLYLRDLNPDLVQAWNRQFGGTPDVETSCGDIFDVVCDAIVSPANSFGFMDGGIDLLYSRHFGWDLQRRLRERIQHHFAGDLSAPEI